MARLALCPPMSSPTTTRLRTAKRQADEQRRVSLKARTDVCDFTACWTDVSRRGGHPQGSAGLWPWSEGIEPSIWDPETYLALPHRSPL